MCKEITFELPDNITIQSITDIHGKLIDIFRQFDEIIIDCSKINYYDMNSLQLLVSVRKSATTKGLNVRLSGVTGALNAALVRAGISPAQLPDSILINGA